jgi:hypothetical protein
MYSLISLLFLAGAPQARPEGRAISLPGTYDILEVGRRAGASEPVYLYQRLRKDTAAVI